MKHLIKKVLRLIRQSITYTRNQWNKLSTYAKEKCFKMNGYIIHHKRKHISFHLPYYNIDYIQKCIYQTRDYFEKNNLEYVCKKWKNGIIAKIISKSIVLDIGCNIGNHTLFYLFECNAQFVHCFEPVKETYRILEKNISINKMESRVKLHNIGIGATKGRAQIEKFDIKNIGGTSIELVENGSITINSIDDLSINQIGFIKIDVEGFEINVLKGMIKTIERDHPYLTIEIRDKNFKEAKTILDQYGYKYLEIEEHRSYRDYNDYLFYYNN